MNTMTTITIPRALLEQAREALDLSRRFVYQDSRPQVDAAFDALNAELAKPVGTSCTAMQLAAMVLSDCGISTNHTALHERVAKRITRHEEQLIDSLQKLAKQAAPAWNDAPEVAALKAERDAAMKDAERMKEGLDAVEVLIDNSSGVAGLHQNGDVASWRELRTGGRFEAWLLAFDEARDVAMKGTP